MRDGGRSKTEGGKTPYRYVNGRPSWGHGRPPPAPRARGNGGVKNSHLCSWPCSFGFSPRPPCRAWAIRRPYAPRPRPGRRTATSKWTNSWRAVTTVYYCCVFGLGRTTYAVNLFAGVQTIAFCRSWWFINGAHLRWRHGGRGVPRRCSLPPPPPGYSPLDDANAPRRRRRDAGVGERSLRGAPFAAARSIFPSVRDRAPGKTPGSPPPPPSSPPPVACVGRRDLVPAARSRNTTLTSYTLRPPRRTRPSVADGRRTNGHIVSKFILSTCMRFKRIEKCIRYNVCGVVNAECVVGQFFFFFFNRGLTEFCTCTNVKVVRDLADRTKTRRFFFYLLNFVNLLLTVKSSVWLGVTGSPRIRSVPTLNL